MKRYKTDADIIGLPRKNLVKRTTVHWSDRQLYTEIRPFARHSAASWNLYKCLRDLFLNTVYTVNPYVVNAS